MRFSKESVKLDIVNRLKFYEDEFGFNSEMTFKDVENNAIRLIYAFGCYDELLNLHTKFTNYAYHTNK